MCFENNFWSALTHHIISGYPSQGLHLPPIPKISCYTSSSSSSESKPATEVSWSSYNLQVKLAFTFYRNNSITIKTDIISENITVLWSYMCSLVEILHVLEEEIGLVCWQLLHDIHAMVNFEFNLPVNFIYFLSNWVNLLDISTSSEKLRAFERNPNLWNSFLMSWRPRV